MIQCDNRTAFVDGELEEAEKEAYRQHLAECEACQAEFVDSLQIAVLLGGMPPRGDNGSPSTGQGGAGGASGGDPIGM